MKKILKSFLKKLLKPALKSFLAVFLLMNLALTMQMFFTGADAGIAIASTYDKPIDAVLDVGDGTQLPSFYSSGQHADAPVGEDGIRSVTSPVFFALDIFRYVTSTIAVLVVVISSIKLMGQLAEEEAKKVKDHAVFGAVGLILIQLADVLVRRMFFGDQGEAFEDGATVEIFGEEATSQLRGIIGFMQVFIGTIAVLVIIVRGFKLMVSAGEEEDMTNAKKHILYAVGGLIVVGLSELVVTQFVFPDRGEALPDVNQGRRILRDITNFISGFIAISAFLSMFYAGYQFVAFGGQEESKEKVKKILISSTIALLLALGAFAIVNTFVQFEDPVDSATEAADLQVNLPDPNIETIIT